ncbi:hypothetical protein BX600DRAFT_475955 [Xylariales sp. PMI_506]|nr:hypothetical protein BX600DRAFT_475955 [Xylariales sp. PMI_506]
MILHQRLVILLLALVCAITLYGSRSGGIANLRSLLPLHISSAHNATDLAAIDPSGGRALITYVYSETPEARRNFEFFVRHGLHAKADFVFIFNGETDAVGLLPNATNIQAVQRNNSCYDLGAHAEVLTKDNLWMRYGKFILMNASVRGPFIPHWADACWSDRLLAKVTDEVKLVGLTLNCWPTPHVQSMVWATDRDGLAVLLHPPKTSPKHDKWMEKLFTHAADFPRPDDYKPNKDDKKWHDKGINQCFANRMQAVEAEIAATNIILGAGRRVDVLLMKMQTDRDYIGFCEKLGAWDPQGEGNYDGASIGLFETMFMKTNRGISPKSLENMSKWVDEMAYSSYDYC